MNLRTLLERYSKGQLSIDELQQRISLHSVEKVANNVAKLDVNREIRKEIPEVIFAKGKEYADLLKITQAAVRKNGMVIVSKVQPQGLIRLHKALMKARFEVEIGKKSTAILVSNTSYRHSINSSTSTTQLSWGKIGILAAGTSDIGIAEEARLMAKAMGCATLESYDVGIAGIHRLFPALTEMISQNVGAIVVVAGMEGALASVVTSMVNVPVIGVPTSVGYGFGSDGVAALASMLQSCTPGLSVVNIDNGIGAGAFAALISNQLARATASTASAPALTEKGTGREKVTRMATRIGEQRQQEQQKQQQKEQRRRKTKEGQLKASNKKTAEN
jgi:pyridinium-3,5-biscarboxylic acid mononucleotide synthase